MNGIKIRGTGRCVPEHIVTNDDMAKIVETNDEWITTRTGIQHRHHCTTESHTFLCVNAAKSALEKAGVTPDEIGACIVATVTGDNIVPSAACMLQKELGLPEDIPCFDLNAACTGFLFALHTMECLLNASPRKFGLVVGAEVLSRTINWADRGTCILFGDGAAAAVVECREGWPSIGAVLGSRGDDVLLRLPGLGRGEPNVLCMDATLKKAGLTPADIDFFVFHQANARIIDLAVRKYRIPPEKYYKNIDRYGNTAAASVPLVLSELVEQGRVGPGSRLLLTAFGGGLTWGGAVLEMA